MGYDIHDLFHDCMKNVKTKSEYYENDEDLEYYDLEKFLNNLKESVNEYRINQLASVILDTVHDNLEDKITALLNDEEDYYLILHKSGKTICSGRLPDDMTLTIKNKNSEE